MREINATTLAAMGNKTVRMAFLALIEFDSPYRLAFTSLLRSYTWQGDTYVGVGSLGTVSKAAASGQLDPAQYEITLSGITDDVLQAAGNVNYMNKPATVWAMILDEDMQVIGDPFIWFRGRTDNVQVTMDKNPRVVIQVRDRLTDWKRPRISRYTDGDQQAMHPGDKGFEFVSQIASREVEWPADTWFEKQADK